MSTTQMLNFHGKNYQLAFHDDKLYRIVSNSGRDIDLRGSLGRKIASAFKESNRGLVPVR